MEARRDAQPLVAERLGEGEGPLAHVHRPVLVAQVIEGVHQHGQDPREPVAVPEALRERLGLPQVFQRSPVLTERVEHLAQVQPDVDGLLGRLAALG